jgi:hypothetical protein
LNKPTETVKVEWCADCPMLEDNPDEGFFCNHPTGNVNRKDIVINGFSNTMPSDCPLKTSNLLVIMD